MKIIFKNVGHGDTIIFQWQGEDGLRIGIIDCNRKKGHNPLTEYLKTLDVKIIDFVIISHPHKDHYSGIYGLLEFCNKEKIKIKTFTHTAIWDISEIYFENEEDKSIFTKIIHKSEELYNSGMISKLGYIGEPGYFNLDQKYGMHVISPTKPEYMEYRKVVPIGSTHSRKEISRAANYLSLIVLISFKDQGILLCSDATKFSLERILHKEKERLSSIKNFMLVQVPHHGSVENHEPSFWSNQNFKNSEAAISCGINDSYQLPDYKVVEYFFLNGFKLRSTNIVYGMKRYLEELNEDSDFIDTIMNEDNCLAEEYISGGDLVYEFIDTNYRRL